MEQSGYTYVDQPRISATDVQALTREPSAKMRAQLCEKICAAFNDKAYSERETEVAIEIMRLLLRDTSIRVRRTLSERLQHNPDVPHDIILKLAHDEEELIAEAVLGSSPVLEEDDLRAIVQSTHSLKKLLAVAGRDSVSAGVCTALIETGEHSVTRRVIENPGAMVNDEMFDYLLDEYYQDDSILEALTQRGNLPYTVAEKLFYIVGHQLRQQLTEQYGLREESIEDDTRYASEHSMLRFLSPWVGQQDIQKLVQELFRQDRLNNSLIIRSLCIGDLRFFWTAMAKRAGASVSNTKMLMLDPSGAGFNAVYDKAAMPATLRSAVRTLYFCALEETELGRYYHDQFTGRVVARIHKEGLDKTVENMPTILGMLNVAAQEMSRHAH